MTVDNHSGQQKISRKDAARLLKVSIRTVDRYVKSKKLSTVEENGHIWLLKGEIVNFNSRQVVDMSIDNVDSLSTHLSTVVDVDRVDRTVDKTVDRVDTTVDNRVDKKGSVVNFLTTVKKKSNTYKKLYYELQEDLKEKQERLEIANYRVGQLEAQVRNSVPMLEYHREKYEKDKKEEELRSKLEESVNLIKTLSTRLKATKFTKRVFLMLLLVILALQPLWIYFIYFS